MIHLHHRALDGFVTLGCRAFLALQRGLQVLGTDAFYAYLNKYGLELDPQLETLVGRCESLQGSY
jgi:hypothetical protein